ncbi:PPR domain-containing protein [Cephalotus follicularis]|uniref:PPR domain-containing protein n=1 Tax=Cephalotus follicularis TaxID=3775 RepID=A0A1Q3CCQ1_CEPFO|nr:PPR domain-containing protein [Cephalotus follicularis]
MQCMVRSFTEIGRFKEAVGMVIEMQHLDLMLSSKTLNSVVAVACQIGLIDYAENAFEEMCDRGLKEKRKMPLYDCMLLLKPHMKKEALMDLVAQVRKHVCPLAFHTNFNN